MQGMKLKHGVSLCFISKGIVIVDKKQSANALRIHGSLLLKFGWPLILLSLLEQHSKMLNLFCIQWTNTYNYHQSRLTCSLKCQLKKDYN